MSESTRDTVIRIARAAGVNCDPAGPGHDDIDTWYGNQYLPTGALTALVLAAMAEERERCAKEAWMAASSDCEDRVAAAIRSLI